jgi:ATP-dependent DNA helicase RecQ
VLAHFGEAIEPCGDACDVCTGVGVTDLVEEVRAERRAAGRAGRRSAGAGARGPGAAPGASWSGGGEEELSQATAGPEESAIFERLRDLRKRLADERGVPAYIVFSDKVLWSMIERSPSTPEEMLDVSGVGPAKLERYGDVFLEALHAKG